MLDNKVKKKTIVLKIQSDELLRSGTWTTPKSWLKTEKITQQFNNKFQFLFQFFSVIIQKSSICHVVLLLPSQSLSGFIGVRARISG
jgi:hypothetical protein